MVVINGGNVIPMMHGTHVLTEEYKNITNVPIKQGDFLIPAIVGLCLYRGMPVIDFVIGSDEIRRLSRWLTEKLTDDMDLIHRMYTEVIGPVIERRIRERINTICDGCQGKFSITANSVVG